MTPSPKTLPSIGIVGCGFVGQAMLRLFGECPVYDPAKGQADREATNRCRFAFVCVPTPTGPHDECDTKIVEETVRWVESDLIVIRSTVAHPLLDHQAQGFSVLGGAIEDTSAVADLYKRLFHASHRFYFTTALCAELAKYMENAFYATKVTFCNEFFDIAQTLGVDYNELREVWLADPRISRDHTFVYPDDRGFGGKCLPKDTAAIIAACEQEGFTPPLLRAVMAANARYRRQDVPYRPFLSVMGPPRSDPFEEGSGMGPGCPYSFLWRTHESTVTE